MPKCGRCCQEAGEIPWYTFAGNTINLAIADALRQRGHDDVKTSDFCIRVGGTSDHEQLRAEIDRLSPEAIRDTFEIPSEY